jgi:hypothetical protein
MNPGLRELIYDREQQALREAEIEKLRKLTPLQFLCAVWQDPDLPMHTRLRAAAEACKYSQPQLKAVAHVRPNEDFAAVLDRAKERVANAYNVIQLQPKAIEHDAAELKPDHSRSPGVNGSGFKRRF